MPEEYLRSLIKLSEEIFKNAEIIEVDPVESWEDDFFKEQWFHDTQNGDKYFKKSPGWYWISSNATFEELKALECPEDLPAKACDIGALAIKNYKIFGEDYLCKKNDKNARIIYNGHQSNVIYRIREHFMLKNQKTGAIGLRYYPFYKNRWQIRFFGVKQITKLSSAFRPEVRRMIEKKSGRIAIENAWRAEYGWPILCKA